MSNLLKSCSSPGTIFSPPRNFTVNVWKNLPWPGALLASACLDGAFCASAMVSPAADRYAMAVRPMQAFVLNFNISGAAEIGRSAIKELIAPPEIIYESIAPPTRDIDDRKTR
jgi:hypothetical protein